MSKFDRAFLIPYLEDLCALYLAKYRLNGKIKDAEYRMSQYAGERKVIKPSPYTYSAVDFATKLCAFGGVFCSVSAFVLFWGLFINKELYINGKPSVFMLLCFVVYLIAAVLLSLKAISDYRWNDKWNLEMEAQNKERMEAYEQEVAVAAVENENRRKMYEKCVQEREDLKNSLNIISDLIEFAFSANVIQKPFRDAEPVFFLYEWFTSGMSNDVSEALRFFQIEDIRHKMDEIIQRLDVLILLARIDGARKAVYFENQRRNNESMQRKLDQILDESELRTHYLKMMETNVKATAYFSAADYLSND